MSPVVIFLCGFASCAVVICIVCEIASRRVRKRLAAKIAEDKAQLDHLTFWRRQSQEALLKAHHCAEAEDFDGMHKHLEQFTLAERRFFAELEEQS